jgi:hypothetical protein
VRNNNPIINELYSYLGSDNLNMCGGPIVYNGEYIDQSLLKMEYKLCNVYRFLENKENYKVEVTKNKNYCLIDGIKFLSADGVCLLTKFETNDITHVFNKVYGVPISEYIDFTIYDNKLCHYYNSEYYCGYIKDNDEITINLSKQYLRKIINVKEKGNLIEIYDIFLSIDNSKCYDNIVNEREIPECSNELNNFEYNKLLSKYGVKYVHKFEKSSQYYSWISSEPFKN